MPFTDAFPKIPSYRRLPPPCRTTPTDRVAAVALGAFILGAGFVTMRILDLKVYHNKWSVYCHLTTWTTLIVGAFFLGVGFTGWNPQTIAAAIGYLAMFVLIMRLLYFEYDFTDWFSAYKEIFAHLLVPIIMIVWLSARQVNYSVGENAWRWKSVLIFVSLIVAWFILNLILRKIRGKWVYGRDAADPGTTKGRMQAVAGLMVAGLCIAFVQLVVVQPCM